MRKLDENQKQAVACNKNAVVSAGAGAGKTTVLSERYYRLISEGKAGVENILTLTFTRKAATEMNERIYKRLLNSTDPAVLNQAADFEKAKISTLDSFSALIVRNGAERFGIPKDFLSDNDASKEIASETALDFILRHQNNKYLKEFISLHSFDSVYEDLFISLAINEINISAPIDFKNLKLLQEKELKSAYIENLEKMEKLTSSILSLSTDIGKAMTDIIELFSNVWDVDEFKKINGFKLFLEISDKIKLTKGRGNHPKKALLNEYIDNWRIILKLTISIAQGLEALPFMAGIFNLLDDFQNEFLSKKRSSGILTFQDVSKMAVSILQEDKELRNFYKKEFKYIMIDEFQDNNLMQKELLYLLAEKSSLSGSGIPQVEDLEPDKLFFVGDEKQSIYSFRGADVSVFKGLSSELIKAGGESLSLSTNYRSEPRLIKFFNEVFDTVMKDSKEPYEADFRALNFRDPSEGLTPEISVFYKPESENDGSFLNNNEAEAWYIANFIKAKVESKNYKILKEGKIISAGYDDFAILMRSTSNQIMYEKYFRKLNIPCTVQSVRALFMEAPVNDIYNLLQLLIYPDDRFSYSALLRSPFVNLSDDVTGALLLNGKSAFAISDLKQLTNVTITSEDIGKYNNISELFFRLKNEVDYLPVADLLRTIWYEGGYRNYIMSNREYHGYLEYYDYLRTLAVQSNARGECLAVFLDFIRENLGKYEKLPDLELLRDETIGVQLLTIHKSKGLEFPVVIVANAGNKGRSGESAPYYVSNDFGVTLKYESKSGKKANYFYDKAKDIETKKELAENKRILYVALTRAQSHLIISGSHNKFNKNIATTTGEKNLLNMILMGIGWDGDPNSLTSDSLKNYISLIPDVSESDVFNAGGSYNKIDPLEAGKKYKHVKIIQRKAVRDTWSASEVNSLFKDSLEPKTASRLSSIESDRFIMENTYTDFGTYCHKIIETKLKKSKSDILLPSSFSNLQNHQLETLKKDASNLAVKFLNSVFARDNLIFDFVSELSFLLNIGDGEKSFYVNGQIDLLIDKKDEVIIIDFKSDKYMNPQEYGVQMFLYRKAAEDIYNKPALSYLFYLREAKETLVNSIFEIDELLENLKKTENSFSA